MANLLAGQHRTRVLLIFELVPHPYDEQADYRLKVVLLANGYKEFVLGTNVKGEHRKIALPRNAFFKSGTTPQTCRSEVRGAAKLVGVRLQSCLATAMYDWAASGGAVIE